MPVSSLAGHCPLVVVLQNAQGAGLMWKLPCLCAPHVELEPLGAHIESCRVFWMRAGQQLRNGYDRTFFPGRKMEVVNKRYMILHRFAHYSRPLETEENANVFLHSLSFFSKVVFDKLQHLVQRIIEKSRVCLLWQRPAWGVQSWTRERRELKGKTGKRKADTYQRPNCSLHIWKRRTMWGRERRV